MPCSDASPQVASAAERSPPSHCWGARTDEASAQACGRGHPPWRLMMRQVQKTPTGVLGAAWLHRASPWGPGRSNGSCVGCVRCTPRACCCGRHPASGRHGRLPVAGRCGHPSCSWRSSPACWRCPACGCAASGLPQQRHARTQRPPMMPPAPATHAPDNCGGAEGKRSCRVRRGRCGPIHGRVGRGGHPGRAARTHCDTIVRVRKGDIVDGHPSGRYDRRTS